MSCNVFISKNCCKQREQFTIVFLTHMFQSRLTEKNWRKLFNASTESVRNDAGSLFLTPFPAEMILWFRSERVWAKSQGKRIIKSILSLVLLSFTLTLLILCSSIVCFVIFPSHSNFLVLVSYFSLCSHSSLHAPEVF